MKQTSGKLNFRSGWPFLALALFAGYYLLPFLDPKVQPGLFGQDASSHLALLDAYCKAFPWFGLHSLPQFFAPIGVDLGLNFDSPIFSAASCLIPTEDPVIRFKAFATIQWLALWSVVWFFSRKKLKHNLPQLLLFFSLCFGSFVQIRSLGHYNLLPLVWGPLALLMLFESPWPLTAFAFIGRALLLAAILLTSWMNLAYLFPWLAYLALRQFSIQKKVKKFYLLLPLALISFLLVLLAFMAPTIQAQRIAAQAPGAPQELSETGRHVFNSEVLSYLIPGPASPLFQPVRDFLADSYPAQQGLFENTNSFEWPVLLLAVFFFLLVIWRRFRRDSPLSWGPWKFLARPHRFFPWLILFYFVLSFGSEIRFANHLLFLNPLFDWLHQIPPFSVSRTPGRYATFVIVMVSVATITQWDHLLSTQGPWLRRLSWLILIPAWLILGLMSAETNQVKVDNFADRLPWKGLNTIALEPQTGWYVAQVPIAITGDPSQNLIQVFHHQPLVNGYVSYTQMSESTLGYLNQNRVFAILDCNPNREMSWQTLLQDPTRRQQTYAQLHKDLEQAKIRFVIINRFLPRAMGCPNFSQALDLMKDNGFQWVDESRQYLILKL